LIKTSRLREMLARAGASGVLLNARHNFAWLSGGRNTINRMTDGGSGMLFVNADGERFLLANSIEIDRLMAEEVPAGLFEPVSFDWRDERAGPDHLIRACRSLGADPANILADLPVMPGIRSAEFLIATCRFSLTDFEIERYRELGATASAAIERVFGAIEPGMTENAIAAATEAEFTRVGLSLPVLLVGADDRLAGYRHPVPSENRWRKALMVVVCAKRGGLIVNLSRIAHVGPVPTELADRTRAARRIFEEICAATRPGMTGSELYGVLAESYRREGCAAEIAKHHQGGATGYKPRDWVAHPASNEVVQANQAFAWNPSLTGTKVEETMIVSDVGQEFVTGGDLAEIREF